MLNCKQATRLLSDSQERPLSLKEKTSLAMHTAMCSGCRNFAKQMGIIRSISRQFARGEEAERTDNKND